MSLIPLRPGDAFRRLAEKHCSFCFASAPWSGDHAHAFGKGNECGVGGWIRFPSNQLKWFAHRFTVQEFTQLGIPVQSDANLDISCYETLAQCFILLCFWRCAGGGRLALRLPALSDNTGAESVCNKLYTSKQPLNLFVRKLSMWSSITGISLECSHIPGEKNDDADMLSRWDGLSPLPDLFAASERFEVSLQDFWNISFKVNLFPADQHLLWSPPAAYILGPSTRGPSKRTQRPYLTFFIGLSAAARFRLARFLLGHSDCQRSLEISYTEDPTLDRRSGGWQLTDTSGKPKQKDAFAHCCNCCFSHFAYYAAARVAHFSCGVQNLPERVVVLDDMQDIVDAPQSSLIRCPRR